MSRCGILGALVVGLLLAAPSADAALRFASTCDGNFACARLTVPLDRTGAVPGTVRLSIERIRTPRSRGAVFALAGGPGQGASSVTESFNRDLAGRVGPRDIVVVDQRGTGRSGALACPELERPDASPIDERTAACARRLGPRRSLYTTEDSVQDLEAVRAAMGYERITLFGVSYGTKVALHYAARFPERVERLVLDSVVEIEGQDPFDLDAFAAVPRVLDELCRNECPFTASASRDVAELVDRMAQTPLRGPFVDRRGRVTTREVTPRDLYQQIRAGDLLADLRTDVPAAVRAALDGDPAPLVRIVHAGSDAPELEPPEDIAEEQSFTLQAATLCEEAALPWERFASPEERDRQAREQAAARPDSAFEPFDRSAALMPDANNLLFQCRRWPAAPARPLPAADRLPDVPTLIVEGLEDVRTPLEVGERVARLFPRVTLVTAPKTGHSVVGSRGCARTALARFFAGRPVGSPCRGARRAKRAGRVPPARLDDVAAPRGTSGLPGRTLGAVALTLADLGEAGPFLEVAGGLRGGTFRQSGLEVLLRRLSYVPGVEVSGRYDPAGGRARRLTVGGAAAAAGTLTLRDGVLSGRLGGRAVRILI